MKSKILIDNWLMESNNMVVLCLGHEHIQTSSSAKHLGPSLSQHKEKASKMFPLGNASYIFFYVFKNICQAFITVYII